MLELAGEAIPARERPHAPLQLTAFRNRVRVESQRTIGEMAVVGWEDGCCTVSHSSLQRLVRAHCAQGGLTIQADSKRLRIGSSAIPVLRYCPLVVEPGASQAECATD